MNVCFVCCVYVSGSDDKNGYRTRFRYHSQPGDNNVYRMRDGMQSMNKLTMKHVKTKVC